MEADDEVELREKFRLSCLTVREDFGGRKILQVFVVCNNIYKQL